MRSNWGGGRGYGGSFGGGSFSGGSFLPFSLNSIPTVKALLIAVTLTFLAFFLTFRSGAGWMDFFVYRSESPDWLTRPWTWVAYPLLMTHPVALLFQGFWLYMVGGSLERSWGSRNFAALFFIFSVIGALGFVPAFYLFREPVALVGLVIPLSAITVAWAALDPEQQILFYGIIPIKLKWLAIVDVLFLYFSYGFSMNPLAAVFSLAAPAAAFYYVRKMPRLNLGFRAPSTARAPRTRQRPLLREDEPPARERVSGSNPLRRRQEQIEIERLRKLLGDDDDRPMPRH